MDQEKSLENTPTTEPSEPLVQPLENAVPVTENVAPPVQPVAVVEFPPENPQTTTPVAPIAPETPSKKPKLPKLIVAAVIVLLLGSGAAAYVKFVINSPENIWKNALQNTSAGYREIVEISKQEPAKGGKVVGSFALTTPLAASGSIKGGWYEQNSQITGSVDVIGVSANAELRTVGLDGDTESADIYFKVDGLDSALPLIEAAQPEFAPIVGVVNGNWYAIDNSLLSSLLPAESSATTMTLTPSEISEIASKVGTVLDERLFTVDKSKAVVVIKDSVGREEFNGHDTYKFNVSVQEQQFRDFATALEDSLKGTAAESLSNDMSANDGVEAPTDIDGFLDSVESSDFSSLRAETWVDMKLKYIRNVRLTPVDKDGKTAGYIDFGLDYSGGDVWPFSISVTTTATDESADTTNASLSIAFNKVSKNLDIGLDLSGSVDNQKFEGNGKISITPSDDTLDVEKPAEATSVVELLGQLLGGDSSSLTQTSFDSLGTDLYPIDDVELQ